MAQDVEAPPGIDVDGGEQRHDAPSGQRDGEVVDARDVVALAVGQHHPYLDLLPLVLEDLGHAPVVGRAKLLAHVAHGQSEGARLRLSAG